VRGGHPQSSQQHLHLLILSPGGEQRRPSIDFEDETPQTPDIYLGVIGFHEHDFRGAIVATLYICELLVAGEAGRAEIDKFDPTFAQFLEDHVLRLDIAVDDVLLPRHKST